MVPVMPSGLMPPHGWLDSGTGVPSCARQRIRPRARDNPYTVSPSVAAMTRPPTTSGWPHTAPSSRRDQAMASRPAAGRAGAAPLRAASR